MLLNCRQLAIEGLARQQVFELGRLRSKVIAYVLLTTQEGPGRPKCFARPVEVPQPGF
jgi:hypothetical protein